MIIKKFLIGRKGACHGLMRIGLKMDVKKGKVCLPSGERVIRRSKSGDDR